MLLIILEERFVNKIKPFLFFIIFLSSLFFGGNESFGQRHKTAPLFDFFMLSADSTIIVSHLQNIYKYPDYFIISKKGDTVNMYTYRYKNLIATSGKVDLPKSVAKAIGHQNYVAMAEAPAINGFFEVKIVDRQILNQFWNEVRKESIWTIKDDTADGEGCPLVKGKQSYHLDDGGGPLFRLITRQGVKDLQFYAPTFYEKYCPGRPGRISAIKVEGLFKTYFTAAGEKDFGMEKKVNPFVIMQY